MVLLPSLGSSGSLLVISSHSSGADLGGGCRGCAPPLPEMTCGFLIQLVFCKKKTMWFIGVEVERETSAPPPSKNPVSAPVRPFVIEHACMKIHENQGPPFERNCIIAKEPKRDKHGVSSQLSPKINRKLITRLISIDRIR